MPGDRRHLHKLGLLVFLLDIAWAEFPYEAERQHGNSESRLYRHMFIEKEYNPLIRPVVELTDIIQVAFGMAMIQIINIDEKNQIMKSNVWLRMNWTDYQLEWNPQEYGGIQQIRVPPHEVWKPDIVLFNNADGKYGVTFESSVVVKHDGSCMWIPPTIYRSSCTIDVKYFPFDLQTCEMKFGSWTFNGDQVTLGWYEGLQEVSLNDYKKSGTWDIVGYPGVYEYVFDKAEGHHVATITFKIKLSRKTLFYTVNLIIPCLLISFLSVCVFFLPADAGEKMTMCISILMALVVTLLLVSKILPPTAMSIPLIAKFLLFAFIMDILSIVITVVVINWNFRTPRTHRMPPWVRCVFLNYLPRLLFMKQPGHVGDRTKKHSATADPKALKRQAGQGRGATQYGGGGGEAETPLSGDHMSDLRQYQGQSMSHNDVHHDFANDLSSSGAASGYHTVPGQSSSHGGYGSGHEEHHEAFYTISSETHKAIEAVRFVAAHLKNEDDYGEILEDWRYIALVIDRLVLCVFLVVIIGGTVGILINAPHILKG